jgi:Uncharacterized conserved protein
MIRIRFDFGSLTLDAELLDTPTAKAVAAALPLSSVVLTWGEEIYFDVPITAPREAAARDVVTPGEIAYWPEDRRSRSVSAALRSRAARETRLASPCNVFARAIGDVKGLKAIKAGTRVQVTKIA